VVGSQFEFAYTSQIGLVDQSDRFDLTNYFKESKKSGFAYSHPLLGNFHQRGLGPPFRGVMLPRRVIHFGVAYLGPLWTKSLVENPALIGRAYPMSE
jgi:hypothetical protein